MRKLDFLIVILLLISGICYAEKNELGTKKMLDNFDELSIGAEKWVAIKNEIARKRTQQCMDAFGYENFCSCLNRELHWVLGFDSYIQTITSPFTGAAPNASPDEKKAIESVYRAREKCVGGNYGTKK